MEATFVKTKEELERALKNREKKSYMRDYMQKRFLLK